MPQAWSRAEFLAAVHDRYLEPITVLQDDDLQLPGDVSIAYYAIYNL